MLCGVKHIIWSNCSLIPLKTACISRSIKERGGGERERESGLLLKIQTNYICIEKLPQIVLGPPPLSPFQEIKFILRSKTCFLDPRIEPVLAFYDQCKKCKTNSLIKMKNQNIYQFIYLTHTNILASLSYDGTNYCFRVVKIKNINSAFWSSFKIM